MEQPPKRHLIVLGTGSEAAWALDILAALNDPFPIRGIVELNDHATSKGQTIDGYEILGSLNDLLNLIEGGEVYIAATRANRRRSDAARRAEVCGILPMKLMHPRATLARSARIEPNVILHPNAVIGPHAKIRAGCIVNTNVTVDGFCSIGPFAHLDVACRVGLRCEVGTFATVGVGATLLPQVRIGRGAIVAPAAVVTEDVDDYAVVSGAPARVVRILDRPSSERETGSIYEEYLRASDVTPSQDADPADIAKRPNETTTRALRAGPRGNKESS